jgi:hypothetical protein
LARKARIQSHDDLASAIEVAYTNVKNRAQKNVDLDAEMKVSTLTTPSPGKSDYSEDISVTRSFTFPCMYSVIWSFVIIL